MDVGDSWFNFDRVGNDAWNTGGTREIATTPDNGKLQLFECVENTLEYSSLNLLEKVKFNSAGRVPHLLRGTGFAVTAAKPFSLWKTQLKHKTSIR